MALTLASVLLALPLAVPAADEASKGQRAAEAELAKRTAAGEGGGRCYFSQPPLAMCLASVWLRKISVLLR